MYLSKNDISTNTTATTTIKYNPIIKYVTSLLKSPFSMYW